LKTAIKEEVECGGAQSIQSPGLLFSRPNWAPPTPSRQGGVAPPTLGPRGETHSLAGKGGGPNSDEEPDTLTLFVYYSIILLRFVCCCLNPVPFPTRLLV
jgi:hypothetical protein